MLLSNLVKTWQLRGQKTDYASDNNAQIVISQPAPDVAQDQTFFLPNETIPPPRNVGVTYEI